MLDGAQGATTRAGKSWGQMRVKRSQIVQAWTSDPPRPRGEQVGPASRLWGPCVLSPRDHACPTDRHLQELWTPSLLSDSSVLAGIIRTQFMSSSSNFGGTQMHYIAGICKNRICFFLFMSSEWPRSPVSCVWTEVCSPFLWYVFKVWFYDNV